MTDTISETEQLRREVELLRTDVARLRVALAEHELRATQQIVLVDGDGKSTVIEPGSIRVEHARRDVYDEGSFVHITAHSEAADVAVAAGLEGRLGDPRLRATLFACTEPAYAGTSARVGEVEEVRAVEE